MSYSNNPLLPKARADAVRLVVEDHLPIAIAARRSGVHRTTLWRWYKRWEARSYTGYVSRIPTESSRPHTPGRAVTAAVVERIRYYRKQYGRCAAIVHAYCVREGTLVSLSTVRRVLSRLGLVARRKWRRHYRPPAPRPRAEKPGDLVQTDTVHLYDRGSKRRAYLYTVVDVCSRWAYAEYSPILSQQLAADVIRRGELYAGFRFATVQADNGPEYGRAFEAQLRARGTDIRHSRVRRPNDNAHVERFNRTIQEECIGSANPFDEALYGKVLTYLTYYNEKRLHLGIQCATPEEVLRRF
jgi:transposase InsO family protein